MGDESTTATLIGNPPIETDVGSAIGSYELIGLLGKGAMGSVYRARHVLLGREVAIKVLSPEYVAQPEIVHRFFREARVVNDIDHEHIVEVTDFVEAPGLAYIVMELLEGASFRDLMAERGRKYPSVKRIVGLVIQVCEALEAAHAKGVVHRDLKPDNIFVVKRDGADFVKVLDFGVAKLRDTADHSATSAGMILGTPHYMSPEQALGHEVDAHTDLWAAGVVLYELLAGEVPFTAPSFVELAMRIREQPYKPLPRRTPRGERIPVSVAAAVAKCLEKRPADRFKSMAALAEALATPSRRASGARYPLMAGAALAVALALLVAATPSIRRPLVTAFESVRAALRAPPLRARELRLPMGTNAIRTPAAPAPTATTATASPARSSSTSTSTSTTETSPAAEIPSKPGINPGTRSPPRSSTTSESATRNGAPPRTSAHAEIPLREVVTPHTVDLVLRSSPPGASVVRLDTGHRLGKTPLHLSIPRKEAVVWLEMTLEGRPPVKFSVDLRRDNTANVTFRGATKPARRRR